MFLNVIVKLGITCKFIFIFCSFLCCTSTAVQIQFNQLFPSSYYKQALEVCMRVLADKRNVYDAMTTSDLCVGRLARLHAIVEHMAIVHDAQRHYPREDITYMIALVRTVSKVRDADIASVPMAAPLVVAIERRLFYLLKE